ncbi:PREDICTED: protein FAM76B-like [Polistes dominula]|uniref:Protein FAM76B-like n=1 Tax=Polistes dominula TaxID=743375 RepID=A0ABM1IEK6_POLDO|nr:PREDICTED: protein FAM76B-like [Polistes dominula]
MSQLSPNSPNEDSSGESRLDRPRLQRSMGQSKKTFRLRKSRRSHVESQMKQEQQDMPINQGTVQTPPPVPAMEPSVFSIPSDSSSIRSRRSLSTRQSDGDRGNNLDQQQFHALQLQHHHYHHHHHLHPQVSDVSWDEDTSSTSGYRESYSMHLESVNNAHSQPPLASPDLNDMPSTSSTTTNYMAFDGSSPDSLMNGSGGEKTMSQHSLLMVFPNQDEDTLI